jgi:sec-independent protein translocase protein TatA
MFSRIGPLEWVIILVIVILIFGAGKLPQLGKAVGETLREFKKSVKQDGSGDEKQEEKK